MHQKHIVTKAEELKDRLALSDGKILKLEDVTEHYPMAVPDYYLSLINTADSDDPI
nr:hypothetical protein [Mediterraneibacter glycyrrhizinilyticus]